MKRTQLYQKAVETYGKLAQEHVLLEEMSELSKVILKGFRGQINMQELIDEVADVEIMLEQIKWIYAITPQVYARKVYKKKRLEKRL
jgi:NTP pyrophosphatase (non-canonical NTP hydrolase)